MAAERIVPVEKLRQNAEVLTRRCANNGTDMTAVTGGCCAGTTIVTTLPMTPICFLGDSCLENPLIGGKAKIAITAFAVHQAMTESNFMPNTLGLGRSALRSALSRGRCCIRRCCSPQSSSRN